MHNVELKQVTVYIFNPNNDKVEEANATIRINYDDITQRKTARIFLEIIETLSLDNINDTLFKRITIQVAAEPGIVRQDAFTDDYYVWYEQPNMMQAKEALYNNIRQNTDWEIAQLEQCISNLKKFADCAARILT